MNQADEVESIGHGRELAADSIPGKKESAIEHGDENAIEAPRNYNEFSVNGNNPLNSGSQSRGAPAPRLYPLPMVLPIRASRCRVMLHRCYKLQMLKYSC